METSKQPRRSPIGQLAEALTNASLPFDSTDLADALWLSQFVEPSKNQLADKESATVSKPSNETIEAKSEIEENIPEATLKIYSDTSSQTSVQQKEIHTQRAQEHTKKLPFSVPAAPALRTRLELARSLRPLMRKVPSHSRFDLDEDATVNKIAETEVWVPVVRPRPERWLELDLVVEDSKSTVIWNRTIAELNHLAEYQGAFRSVRTWRMLSTSSEESQLFTRWRESSTAVAPDAVQMSSLRPHTPRELIDPTGRRLIWLVTDCTSAGWRNGLIHKSLLEWSEAQPIAVMQMFPNRLWSKTALRNGHIVKLSALRPGLPSAQLEVKGIPKRLARKRTSMLTLPIISLEAGIVHQWAKVVSGAGDTYTPGRTFDLDFIHRQSSEKATRSSSREMSRSAKERVALFRAVASEPAQKLVYLMAAAPVTLPVVDLIREAFRSEFLPHEIEQCHIAEILLSGLLRRADTKVEEECRYEFWGDRSTDRNERVRDILLGDASISKTIEVLNVLSESICRKLDSPVRSFQALLSSLNASEEEAFSREILPFAQVGLDVLRRLGGEYAAIADHYEEERAAAKRKKAETFLLQVIEYEVAKLINFPPLETTSFESKTITEILSRFVFHTYRNGESTKEEIESSNWGYLESLGTDTEDITMMAIPDGSFLMGTSLEGKAPQLRELPKHEVTIPLFYMCRSPITQAQWKTVSKYDQVDIALDSNPSLFMGETRPVESVSWEAAREFCKRLSKATDKNYCLPSEAQWEYACRSGSQTDFYFGDWGEESINQVANIQTNENGKLVNRKNGTTDVCSFLANAWGLCDMHGNVWEWCEDDWHHSYENAPTDGTAWLNTDKDQKVKVVRGGCWNSPLDACRSAARQAADSAAGAKSIGFRICRIL